MDFSHIELFEKLSVHHNYFINSTDIYFENNAQKRIGTGTYIPNSIMVK